MTIVLMYLRYSIQYGIAVFLRYQDGMNSLVAYIIIHIFYSNRLRLEAQAISYQDKRVHANGVVHSLFKDRLFITITTHSLCSCIYIYIYSDHTHSLKLINDPWLSRPSILCSFHIIICIECQLPM